MANALILALRHDRPPGEFIVLQLLWDREGPQPDLNKLCELHMQQTWDDIKWADGVPTITKLPVYKAVWWVDAEMPEES